MKLMCKKGLHIKIIKNGQCKECHRISIKKWQDNHRKEINSRAIKWMKDNPEKNKIIRHNFSKNNPGYSKVKSKKWAKDNPKRRLKHYWITNELVELHCLIKQSKKEIKNENK